MLGEPIRSIHVVHLEMLTIYCMGHTNWQHLGLVAIEGPREQLRYKMGPPKATIADHIMTVGLIF